MTRTVVCRQTRPWDFSHQWSGRESNPRPSHCERDALPTELPPRCSLAAGHSSPANSCEPHYRIWTRCRKLGSQFRQNVSLPRPVGGFHCRPKQSFRSTDHGLLIRRYTAQCQPTGPAKGYCLQSSNRPTDSSSSRSGVQDRSSEWTISQSAPPTVHCGCG